MNEIQMARLLGLLSVGLGAAELAVGRQLAKHLGVRKPQVIQTFGAREIGTGLAVMTYPDYAWPMWIRVGGDVLDLAALAGALGSGNRRRHNAAWATIGVLGVTLVDIAVATMLTRREFKAQATAKRTRIRRKLGEPMPKIA